MNKSDADRTDLNEHVSKAGTKKPIILSGCDLCRHQEKGYQGKPCTDCDGQSCFEPKE